MRYLHAMLVYGVIGVLAIWLDRGMHWLSERECAGPGIDPGLWILAMPVALAAGTYLWFQDRAAGRRKE
ncbi:hypothetical protein [Sulfobacillus harzensis]|uniref:Uncharacterized protein n=1 Tax=Sulfobacillus harzensis TaxID=2729629 RepID=A0A7Y0L7L7_9FIRM|nr:hypothetical protein [Sulfobacillus harzensis]NMP24809.1 hypothetical protein [Sulfobacillus harzensis]